MIDHYPTRKSSTGKFIVRRERVSYQKPDQITDLDFYHYNNRGFVVLRGFFEDVGNVLDYANELYSTNEIGLTTYEPNIQAIRSITGVHFSPVLLPLLQNLQPLACKLLGSDVYIHQSRINYKTYHGNGWWPHSDFETWHVQDGMPGMRCFTAMIPLTENTDCNGPFMVIPGSHKMFYLCPKGDMVSAQDNFADQKEGVPGCKALEYFIETGYSPESVLCSPGDLVLFDCNIIHFSNMNMTPIPRINLFFVFNSVFNKLVDPFDGRDPRPEEMATRLTYQEL